jgi:CspA family cold shock protein
MQVAAGHKVDLSTAEAPSARAPRSDLGGGDYQPNKLLGAVSEGKVKFFNEQKGFGFVTPDSGTGDFYLHAAALRRSGIRVVESEQRIRFSTRRGHKGVEVDRVELI